MKKTIYLLCLLLITSFLFAESQKQRLAVISFDSENLSKAETNIITKVFEAALVKTKVFDIIEQTKIEDILTAQEFSLSGCTDETCAIEIGKLLAAEQIILGDVSALGNKIVMVARIIDVTSGKNLRAEMIEVEGIDAISDGAGSLAQLLAGVTTAFSATVSSEKGSLLIASEPKNADIFINGVIWGTTPELLENISYGKIFLEIKSGNLSASEVVTVSESFQKISLILETGHGDLFIKTDRLDVTLFIDGKNFGNLVPSGYYEGIESGKHFIELRSDGEAWQGEVIVLKDEVSKVEPQFSAIPGTAHEEADNQTAITQAEPAESSETGIEETSLLLEKTSPGRFLFQDIEYRGKEIVPALRETLALPLDIEAILTDY
ncbi:MAG: PEGA domain-containing protein, partial [Spirochaetales bacterium]|nr:PEGA domain-containing protein [Spirochaetales bacterium]